MSQRKSDYLPSAENLFEFEASKSQKQRVEIVRAAIKSFALNGIEKTTYTSLAKECGVSRPLIHHYFPTLDSLFLLAARFARQTLLECVTDGLARGQANEKKQLEGYIEGCFHWVKMFPLQAKFWMLYYYQAALDDDAHAENTQLVDAGHDRIKGILEIGKKKGLFDFGNANETAKMIQVMITGGIVSVVTESGFLKVDNASDLIQKHVHKLLRT